MDWLDPVQAALDAAARPVPLFFRDDDAGWRHDRMWPLLDLFAERALPLDVAVIPAALERGPAAELASRAAVPGARLGLHQHGFAHINHEPDGRKLEFGPSRSRVAQRRDIEAGADRLAQLLGQRLDPIFTPPWNRCTADTGSCLLELGFHVLSREARAAPLDLAGVRELSVHVDWFAHRHGARLTPTELGERLAGALRSDGPVGVMFHHAEMNGTERSRADDLLALLAGHERAKARPMMRLV